MINYTFFLKALAKANLNMQKYFENFMELDLQIFLKGICAKIYAKFYHLLLFFQGFSRAIRSRNPMTGSGSKYRFSRVKVK